MSRWFDVYAFRIGEPHERKVAVLFNDITGRKCEEEARKRAEHDIRRLLIEAERREEELREKQAQLVQTAKMASLGEMASGIAHELNNPLNNINLFVGNVLDRLREAPLDPGIEQSLTLTQREITKAATIINQLRTFARKATTVVIAYIRSYSFAMLRMQVHEFQSRGRGHIGWWRASDLNPRRAV